MVARRTLFGLVAVVGVAGCSANPAVVSKVRKLQEAYAKEPGVVAVELRATLRNESMVTTEWTGGATLDDGLTVAQQAQLITRFFDLATSQDVLRENFEGITFALPKKYSLVFWSASDATQSLEIVQMVNRLPEGSAGGWGGTAGSLSLQVRLPATDVATFVTAATGLVTLPRPQSFMTNLSVRMEGNDADGTALHSTGIPSAGELGFLMWFPSWLASYGATWFSLPLTDDPKALFRIGTAKEVSAGVKVLAETARTAELKHEIRAFLGKPQGNPYLTIPRG